MEKRWIVLALIALLITLPAAGALNGQKSQRTSKTFEARKTQEERLQILQQELPRLADSALALQNVELKIETLGQLADLSWSHDAPGARQLFQRTYELLRSIEPADDRPQSKPNDATAQLQRTKLIGLYIRFFSRVAKYEPAWKEQLLTPNQPELADSFFQKEGLRFETVVQAKRGELGVKLSPTLILADASGIVHGSWIGQLSPQQETEIWNMLRN